MTDFYKEELQKLSAEVKASFSMADLAVKVLQERLSNYFDAAQEYLDIYGIAVGDFRYPVNAFGKMKRYTHTVSMVGCATSSALSFFDDTRKELEVLIEFLNRCEMGTRNVVL